MEYKERLIASVKKEVKQLMEEAVTRKFVHEESGSVVSLCAAVEACLSQGLRRRALGLFKTSSTTALLHKVAKNCPEAAHISQKVQEIENSDPNKRSSSSSDSVTKPTITKKGSTTSMSTISGGTSTTPPVVKYLWIRLALFEKRLAKIIDHLVTNAVNYYDKDSLVADPDYGSILSSLLVGPCALEFSRAKTPDYFWSDPHADELVQRHRISSGNISNPSCGRPIINFKRSLNASSDDVNGASFKSNSSVSAAKDYVESLHQNARATLLYGKNNVLVLPKDVNEAMPGYLSLHQNVQSLTIKWTPNQLMNGYNESQESKDKSSYWNYALNINVEEIVYVHCHQNRGEDTGGTVILVGQDGVQQPPIHFPEGGHMAAFLSCLETGLLPHGQLDPPLWSQRGIGKLFSWPQKHKKRVLSSVLENLEANDENIPIDYVFRVVNKGNHQEFLATHQILDIGKTSPRRVQLSSCSTNESSDGSSKSMSLDQAPIDNQKLEPQNKTASIALVCSTMRRQIISRAFYGWLAYCRHLSTVRTHLSGLVNGRITPNGDASEGLTKDRWLELHEDGIIKNEEEVYRLVYYGGVQHEIRKDVWPYLLGHYQFGQTQQEKEELDDSTKHYYETTMSEWLAVEAIIRQKDKEKTAMAVAKLSSGSGSGDKNKDPNHFEIEDDDDDDDYLMENDVFEEDNDSSARIETEEKKIFEEPMTKKPNKSSTDSGNVPDDTDIVDTDEQKQIIETESEDAVGDGTTSCPEIPTPMEGIEKFASIEDIAMKINDDDDDSLQQTASVIVTNASIDISNFDMDNSNGDETKNDMSPVQEECNTGLDALQEPKSACVSPASSNGGVYSTELLDSFGLNLHRIDKDVQRCDRNYWYFANENLDKLRNVICTYVWEHLDVGYMQGMCDLVAPLLVIFDDESLSYGCFCKLMERMIENFPSGGAMDMHFANMRSLIQILDSEMYELMDAHGDYTHFYFCYRWFLLDFKRELVYTDVFQTWEIIWAAKYVASSHFVLFLALALLETYRDIILSNSMDFTDVIKFFNEMAERHNMVSVLELARNLVLQLQTLIENK
ncbi:SGSM2 family protein [Megaselia abdita]